MRGSDKQVRWAESIRENLVETYRNAAELMPEEDRPKMQLAIDQLNRIDNAGTIIEAYKSIRFTGDVQHDFLEISACHHNMTPDELAIFMPEEV